MAEMDAIEIAERDRGAAGIRRQPLPIREDPHQPRIGTRIAASFSIITSSFTPSAWCVGWRFSEGGSNR